MDNDRTVFSQVIDFVPLHEFRKCVRRYHGSFKVRKFSCLDQFLCMCFAQLTFRESLRDIEVCLRSVQSRLYHMGIRGRVARSTLADANERRDWRIYRDFAHILIGIARPLYVGEQLDVDLESTAYALDSTTIDLCLSLFPWARFRRAKGAIKLHTLLDLRGSIPTFIHVSDGKLHDVNVLDLLVFEPGSFYIMDKGYVDFSRLFSIHQASAFFVIRSKRNFQYRRRSSTSQTVNSTMSMFWIFWNLSLVRSTSWTRGTSISRAFSAFTKRRRFSSSAVRGTSSTDDGAPPQSILRMGSGVIKQSSPRA